jgi:hypothetical protein
VVAYGPRSISILLNNVPSDFQKKMLLMAHYA